MAEIQKAPLSRLPLATLLSFGKSVEAKIDSSNIVKTDFKPHYDSFKSSLQILDECNSRILYTQVTLVLNQLASQRSKIRTSIINIILSYINYKDSDIVASAINLKSIIKLLKGYYKKSHFQQTAIISNFITIAQSDTYKKDIERLHLSNWITYLDEVNTEYAQKRLTRVEAKGTKNQHIKSSEARALFLNSYLTLWNRLNSLANVNGDKIFIELFSFWNALVDELRMSISMQKGMGKGGKLGSGSYDKPDETSGPVLNGGDDDRPVIEAVVPKKV